jgi:hypothetical protein
MALRIGAAREVKMKRDLRILAMDDGAQLQISGFVVARLERHPEAPIVCRTDGYRAGHRT